MDIGGQVAQSSWQIMLDGIEGSWLWGEFSLLQEAFQRQEQNGNRICVTDNIRSFLRDFKWLAGELCRRPTNIAELIPAAKLNTKGACDASGAGMGGVHFVPTITDNGSNVVLPVLW